MQSFAMWHSADVVLADVSEDKIASFFRVERKINLSFHGETMKKGVFWLWRRVYVWLADVSEECSFSVFMVD